MTSVGRGWSAPVGVAQQVPFHGSRLRLVTVKEFLLYTALRLAVFAATLGVVLGIWLLVAGSANLVLAVVLAIVLSGVASYFLLARPRAALAARVEARAERATRAFEEMRAKEDVD